jgi:hypothetical protein
MLTPVSDSADQNALSIVLLSTSGWYASLWTRKPVQALTG